MTGVVKASTTKFAPYIYPLKPTSEAGYSRRSVALPEQGVDSFSNEAPLPYPIAECEALAEEEDRFFSGMKRNAKELMDLSNLANQYLQQSQDEPPPIIDTSSPPSEIFSTLSLIRRQMKEGMDLLKGFEDLRLQRRELGESLHEQVTRASSLVEVYDESMRSQGGATGDEVRSSDEEQVPQSSTVEEQTPLQTNHRTTPGTDVDESSSSDESFYCGLKDESASEDGA
ncbi:hypothetical protein FRC00_005346 [Tulasnella sp. 408]|nr:hypothetical protein FRC00_005346 [Tulasnella sp. 408]